MDYLIPKAFSIFPKRTSIRMHALILTLGDPLRSFLLSPDISGNSKKPCNLI